ncbi:hypothetical protein SAMN04488004_10328 [Loktanella salsilacus]|uniref:Uncharacterized protein n=1 Tax=Loktanella salsilacus TaxID=195913 RepID=A0A1I4CV09_9RHOB|nr:hypothetical protein SAMN04488004_10328 [Loktanella salsilacus]
MGRAAMMPLRHGQTLSLGSDHIPENSPLTEGTRQIRLIGVQLRDLSPIYRASRAQINRNAFEKATLY